MELLGVEQSEKELVALLRAAPIIPTTMFSSLCTNWCTLPYTAHNAHTAHTTHTAHTAHTAHRTQVPRSTRPDHCARAGKALQRPRGGACRLRNFPAGCSTLLEAGVCHPALFLNLNLTLHPPTPPLSPVSTTTTNSRPPAAPPHS